MKRLLLFGFISALFFLLIPLLVSAQQAPTIAWDKSFGGNLTDELTCMIPTSDGGFILGGASLSGISGDKTQATRGTDDYWIVKIDSKGNKQWDKTYGGNVYDGLTSIQQTPDNGYVLAGMSSSFKSGEKSQNNLGSTDFWILKLDNAGNKVWDKTIGANNDDDSPQIILTSDGGFLLAGSSNSSISGSKSGSSRGGSYDFWVLKLDVNGTEVWDKSLGGNQLEVLREIKQTPDGGYLLGGTSWSSFTGDKNQYTNGDADFWLVKIDAAGNKVWDKAFGGIAADILGSVILTSDGGFMLSGNSTSGVSGDKSQPNVGGVDFWVVKTDANGNKQWDKTFGGIADDIPWSLRQTATGNYVLGGLSRSGISGSKSETNIGNYDFWVLNIDAAGNKLWDKTMGGSNMDWVASLHENGDGSYLLGGVSSSGISGSKTQPSKGLSDYWLIKLNAPCTSLTANVTPECIVGGTRLALEIKGTQQVRGKISWTLNYLENGIAKTLSDSVNSRTLSFNPKPGTVFKLVSITSGTCVTIQDQTITIPAFPIAPLADPVRRCGAGSVTFTATGAPAGGKYLWYKVAANGVPLQADSVGKFTTPDLSEPALYYVSVVNTMGCEGPRTQVSASLDYCPPVYIPNIITPNNDGKNDTFQPQNLAAGKWELQVFNRWGKMIYQAAAYQNDWPDKEISAGTYYYLLTNTETKETFKGWLEVTEKKR